MADSKKNLSGLAWFKANQSKYSNSNKIPDLDSRFKSSVQALEKALKAAGSKISVSSTKRSKSRAAIMHYAWMVAKKKITPKKVPKIKGVDITSTTGTTKSRLRPRKTRSEKAVLISSTSLA